MSGLWFGVVTLFPEMIEQAAAHGVFRRAQASGVVEVATFNPRDHAEDRHATVDDKPYGGGPGMVMMAEPVLAAVAEARAEAQAWGAEDVHTVLLSPQGAVFDQRMAEGFADRAGATIFICGRYEGVDQRIIDLVVDTELSVGDYVLSGGELPALAVMDAIARLSAGAIGNPDSLLSESHLDGSLEYPQYTRPEIVQGLGVPAELLSGDHKRVRDYRRSTALAKTFARRPELLLAGGALRNPHDRSLLRAAIDDD